MLRSDTGVRPTEAMRRAMASATDGDDFYREDPTVRELESVAAQMLGKPASLFVPTGTMANSIAALVHGCGPDRLLTEAQSHIGLRERNPPSLLSAFKPRYFESDDGYPTPAQLREHVRENGAAPALLCVENTFLWHGGTVIPLRRCREVYEEAKRLAMRVHLDGARLVNAAVALNVSIANLASTTDSLMLSLCKGIGAPIGAMLAGPEDFIEESRRVRTALGGTLRLAGPVAAAALVALRAGYEHISEDHAKAQRLARALARFEVLGIRPEKVHSNIILFNPSPLNLSGAEFAKRAEVAGVRVSLLGPETVRLVTHRDLSDGDVAQAVDALCSMIDERLKAAH